MKQAHVIAPLTAEKGEGDSLAPTTSCTHVLLEGEGTPGRTEDSAFGHMQNMVFEELKACYVCKIAKNTPRMLLHFRKWPAQPFLGLDRILGNSRGSPGDRPPCSHWEENCQVQFPYPWLGMQQGSASPQGLVPLPWHWWGEELARFGFCSFLGWGVDTCHKHCDFGRSVCFFAALLVGESLQY